MCDKQGEPTTKELIERYVAQYPRSLRYCAERH